MAFESSRVRRAFWSAFTLISAPQFRVPALQASWRAPSSSRQFVQRWRQSERGAAAFAAQLGGVDTDATPASASCTAPADAGK